MKVQSFNTEYFIIVLIRLITIVWGILYDLTLYSIIICCIITELEWKLSELGAIKTDLEENPFKKREIRDVLSVAVRDTYRDAEDSDDDSD